MLEEYMLNIGYSEEQFELISNSYPLNTLTESTLLFNMKSIVNFLHRNGLSNDDIVRITCTIPNLIVTSTEKIKNRVKELINIGFNKLEAYKMIGNYPYIIELPFQKILNKYSYLSEFGFSHDNINEILINKTDIISIDNTSLKKRINYFLDYGFTIENIINIINVVPEVIDIRINYINKIMDEFNDYGFSRDNIIRIITNLPNLFIFKDSITDNLGKLNEIGYSNNEIISIVSKIPGILRKSYFDNINVKFELLKSYNLSNSDIVNITVNNPYILMYSNDKLIGNIDCLLGFYSNDEINKMIINFPLLLGYDASSLNKKITFYKNNGLYRYICNNSHLLNFNLDLIEAREKFISENKTDNTFYKDLFDNNSCITLFIDNLFLSEDDFYNIYKKTTDDLLRRS